MKTAAALLAFALALTACGGASKDESFERDGDADNRLAASAENGEAGTMPFGPDFAELKLGPHLDGSDFETTFEGADGKAGILSGYVACAGAASCEDAGDAAVYTYVVTVTPDIRASVLRTAHPAYGFTGTAGYDQTNGRAAIPGDSKLVLRCVDGALVWSVSGGEGWSGAPVTFYWQSDSPPGPKAEAYRLIARDRRASAEAPLPTEGSTDKCA